MVLVQRKGVVLIIVMIVVSGLSTLAFGLIFRARVRIKRSALNIQNAQAYYLAIGGIEKGKDFLVEKVLNDPEGIDIQIAKNIPFQDQLSEEEEDTFTEGKDVVQKLEYAVFDEFGFININKTNPVNLMKLNELGEVRVSRLIDWIDEDSELSLSESAESDYYVQQSRPYTSKNKEFTHLRELLFIKDVGVSDYIGRFLSVDSEYKFKFFDETVASYFPDSSIGLVNLFTVYGEGKLNLNTVPAVILASLPGIELPEAEMLVDYRNNLSRDECISNYDFLEDLNLNEIQKSSIVNNCCLRSNVFRVYSYGKVGQSSCCLMAVVEYVENELKVLSLERFF